VTIKATAGSALPKFQTFVLAAAGSRLVQISMSKATENVLAIAEDGSLWATGQNTHGQLGIGAATALRVLTKVGTDTNWRQVSMGSDHAVATRTDGTLWAFGRNNNGQAGQGSLTTTQYNSPTQIGTGTDWAWAVSGANHCVAVKTNGTLWAWGANGSGQCGQGNTTTTNYPTPTQVGTATNWSEVGDGLYAGADFTLALRATGTLWSWGSNANGQLGIGSTTTGTTPAQIGSLNTWNRVVAGNAFALATRTDNTLWIWGINSSGQHGNGNLTQAASPVQSLIGTDLDQIACGAEHVVATRTDGTLWTWGRNNLGQLGQGNLDTQQAANTPVKISDLTGWQIVAASANGSLATRGDGLHGWGINSQGQLSMVHRVARPLVHHFGRVSMAVTLNAQSYVLREDGSIWGLGYNINGSLGLGGSTVTTHTPVAIGSGSTWQRIAGGTSGTDAVFFAIRDDGTLWGMGLNAASQLGDGTTTNRTTLTQIGTNNDWAEIVTTGISSHALKQDGTLWAWGTNTNGQLGDGTTTASTTPVKIGTDTDWRSIAASGLRTLALKTNGTLWGWGLNTNGQIGDNSTTQRNAPVQVGTATDWRSITAGTTHSSGIKTNGTLWAWGLNSSNQLGDGTTTQRNSPVQIGTATDWRSISASATFSIGTRANGTLWSWGSNFVGRMGRANLGSTTTPTQVGNSSAWAEVQQNQNANHSLVTTLDGKLWAFGWNAYGQIAFAGRHHFTPEMSVPLISNTAQTLAFTAFSTVPVGDTITLNATASSALPARYIVTGPASLNGDKLTITSAGLVSIIAYQPGDSYWQASDLRHAYINLAAPTATTLAATSVGTTTATLNATVNPNGSATTALFQSGTSISYGTNSPITLTAPSGVTAENVSQVLTGLLPGTTYHFRISTSNLGGTDDGENVTFTTLSNDASLSALAMSTGTLSPAFASSTLSYTASVTASTASLNLAATTANANATLQYRVNGSEYTTTNGIGIPVTLETGLNTVQIEVTAEDEVTLRLYTLQITRPPGYTQWSAATGITGPNSGPDEDFDGDGIMNLMEFAFGTQGNTQSSGRKGLRLAGGVIVEHGQPIALPVGPGGSMSTVFIRRKDASANGLTYTVNFTTNFSNWEVGSGVPTVLADDGIYETVALPFPPSSGPDAAPTFFTVTISLTP
jgi:alpha-tubulin suppressor-like RCC1 family protein